MNTHFLHSDTYHRARFEVAQFRQYRADIRDLSVLKTHLLALRACILAAFSASATSKRARTWLFLFTLTIGFSASELSAALITVPTSLSPGDPYRLAFVTSTTRNAASAVIADYNTFVHTTAISVPALQALGTTWTAIGSTAAVDARDNTGTNPTVSAGEPIFLLNDTLIANNYADLWDNTIQTQINFTEIETVRNDFTWTGSNSLGLKDPFGLTLGSATGVEVGQITSLTIPWIAAGFSPTNTDLKPLYAISGVLTVVPEPHYLAVAALVFGAPVFGTATENPILPCGD